MKRYFANIFIFSVLVVVFIIGLVTLSEFFLKLRKLHLLKISDDINVVFAGNSSLEFAVNDSLILNSINISQSGEAFLYSYAKIRSLLEYNNQINTIFISYSFEDILKRTEEEDYYSNGYVYEKIRFYNYLLRFPEKILIIRRNPKAYLRGWLDSANRNFITFIKSFYSKDSRSILNFGGYRYLNVNNLQELIILHEKDTTYLTERSSEKGLLQEKYLKMISQLCREKSIKLILLNPPKSRYYNTNINEKIIQNWLSVRNSLSRDSLLDLSALELPDSCYSDLIHLNYKGATTFSQYLNKKMHKIMDDSLRVLSNEGKIMK